MVQSRTRSKKMKKRPRDPRRPKKPAPNFVHFFKENREEFLKHPMMNSLRQAMAAKVAGKMWKKASPDVKSRANAAANQDKLQYTQAAKKYRPPTDEEWQYVLDNWPKKFRTSYNFFVMDWFGKIWRANPGIKFGEVSQMIASRWAQLEDKTSYYRRYVQDRNRYIREVEALWTSLG